MSGIDEVQLATIRTYIQVAWIISIIVLAIWAIGFVYYFVYFFIFLGLLSVGSNPYYNPGSIFIGIGLAYGIFFIIFSIPAYLVFRRTRKMKAAVDDGDIETVKKLNTMAWIIVSFIFAGVIPGIMMLLVNSQLSGKRVSSKKGVSGDNLDKMAKLKSLLDSGAITKEEFDAQKAEILNPQGKQQSDLEEKLGKLKSLYDSGTLTEAEYNEQRKKLLSDL